MPSIWAATCTCAWAIGPCPLHPTRQACKHACVYACTYQDNWYAVKLTVSACRTMAVPVAMLRTYTSWQCQRQRLLAPVVHVSGACHSSCELCGMQTLALTCSHDCMPKHVWMASVRACITCCWYMIVDSAMCPAGCHQGQRPILHCR